MNDHTLLQLTGSLLLTGLLLTGCGAAPQQSAQEAEEPLHALAEQSAPKPFDSSDASRIALDELGFWEQEVDDLQAEPDSTGNSFVVTFRTDGIEYSCEVDSASRKAVAVSLYDAENRTVFGEVTAPTIDNDEEEERSPESQQAETAPAVSADAISGNQAKDIALRDAELLKKQVEVLSAVPVYTTDNITPSAFLVTFHTNDTAFRYEILTDGTILDKESKPYHPQS